MNKGNPAASEQKQKDRGAPVRNARPAETTGAAAAQATVAKAAKAAAKTARDMWSDVRALASSVKKQVSEALERKVACTRYVEAQVYAGTCANNHATEEYQLHDLLGEIRVLAWCIKCKKDRGIPDGVCCSCCLHHHKARQDAKRAEREKVKVSAG